MTTPDDLDNRPNPTPPLFQQLPVELTPSVELPPTSDPLVYQVFERFAPLMKRILERDPYALMGLMLEGFSRDDLEAHSRYNALRFVLTVHSSYEQTHGSLLNEPLYAYPGTTDEELDAWFTKHPPQ